MKKICIIGAKGYIGSQLLIDLKKKYKIISVSRKNINEKDYWRYQIKKNYKKNC